MQDERISSRKYNFIYKSFEMTAQKNCKLAIKLDNNENAIYTPGATISGFVCFQNFHPQYG